jgi:hypothetical protein
VLEERLHLVDLGLSNELSLRVVYSSIRDQLVLKIQAHTLLNPLLSAVIRVLSEITLCIE